MYALTLQQPWATAIIDCGKDVENRTWQPPNLIIGKRIAIHAGKTLRRDDFTALVNEGFELPARLPQGLILGSVVVAGWVRGRFAYGLTTSEAKLARASLWNHNDAYAWVLRHPRPLATPIAALGQQKLWPLPADVLAAMRTHR
jgi:hypothetical protein